jgi:hypothetical protein
MNDDDQTYAPPAILRTVCFCATGADRCIPCRRALEVRENIMVDTPSNRCNKVCAVRRVAPCCVCVPLLQQRSTYCMCTLITIQILFQPHDWPKMSAPDRQKIFSSDIFPVKPVRLSRKRKIPAFDSPSSIVSTSSSLSSATNLAVS